MRELLCVSQSSKEQLRRSRTESSGAAPAIEELPGAARQCKARRAACGEAGSTIWPSHGRGGLEGARPSSSLDHQTLAEVSHSASLPTASRRSRKFPRRYRLSPSEEVWRATGPPVPASIISPRKFSISPLSRSRTAEVGNSHSGTVSAHPKRSGGRPALQLPRALFPRGSSHSASSHKGRNCIAHIDLSST